MLLWLTIALIFTLCFWRIQRDLTIAKHGLGISLALCGTTICALLLAGEGAFRILYWIRRDINPLATIQYFEDPELGWNGHQYELRGSPTAPKLLVLGDSFTEGMGLPRESLYFSKLQETLSLNVAAYAGQGFGTLQELLMLRRWHKDLQPDIVLLQLCSNDFINNSWALEHRSALQAAPWIRPYLENGKVVLRYPRSLPQLRMWLIGQSRMFHFVFRRLDVLNIVLTQHGYLSALENELKTQGATSADFGQAKELTKELIMQIKKEAAPAKLVAFVVDNEEPAQSAFTTILGEIGVPYDASIGAKLKRAEHTGALLRLDDGVHLNPQGHRLLAELLVPLLRQK